MFLLFSFHLICLFFFFYSILLHLVGSTAIVGEKIPGKTVSKHCWTGRILIVAALDRDSSENLVSKSTSQSETLARSWNRKNSYGTNGPYIWYRNLYEYGLFSTKWFDGKRNAFDVEIRSATMKQRIKQQQQQFFVCLFDENVF